MKKAAAAILSVCLIFSASSAVSAAAPVEKQHEKKMHAHAKKEHKLHTKSHRKSEHKLHAKSLHSKSLKAKEITQMPKTGFGGASEQTE